MTGVAKLGELIPSSPDQFECLKEQSTEETLYLKWWRPSQNSYCLTHYKLEYEVTGSADTKQVIDILEDGSVFEIRYLLKDLKPCTSYDLHLVGATPEGKWTPPATLTAKTTC